jgi:hypothetical protein
MNFEKAGGGRGEGSARDAGRQEGAKGTTAGGGSAIPPPPVPLNPSDTAFPSPLRARPSQQGHINRSVSPPPPYPPVQPAKTNADVVSPLSAVQTALPEPEYPSSLQGNPPTDRRHAVSSTDALAARGGSRQAQRRSGSAQASAQRAASGLALPYPRHARPRGPPPPIPPYMAQNTAFRPSRHCQRQGNGYAHCQTAPEWPTQIGLFRRPLATPLPPSLGGVFSSEIGEIGACC